MSVAAPPRRPPAPAPKPSTSEPSARGLAIPIPLGPLRGYWWQLSSGGKVARLLMGTYEPEQSALFRQHIQPGQQVLDIGAAAGYYTLLAARLVGPTGSIVAFEPNPQNRWHLQAHVRTNRLQNVRVLSCAVADREGNASFGGGSGSGTSRLQQDGEYQVQVRRLDDLAEEHQLAPHHVKIDVEGAELDVFRGGERLFRKHRPTIFLSTHGPDVHRACCELLEAWGYRLQPIVGNSVTTATELLCQPRART